MYMVHRSRVRISIACHSSCSTANRKHTSSIMGKATPPGFLDYDILL